MPFSGPETSSCDEDDGVPSGDGEDVGVLVVLDETDELLELVLDSSAVRHGTVPPGKGCNSVEMQEGSICA